MMTRELLLLRHGKSDWSTGADDFNRPIKDRGKRGAQRQGVWLAQHGLEPDYAITSPAERALVTAQKTLKAMGGHDGDLHKDSRIYDASLRDLLSVLANVPTNARRVLLVGHNPGLEQLLEYLLGSAVPEADDGKLMPTATLTRLQLPDDWSNLQQGSATLLSLIRPASLPEKFPFPSPDGEERRDRPAYYYTQSSVIPYRIKQGKPQILVISSSKQKHFVVPKGIKDPGLTPQDSAAKEAQEEAGALGQVEDTAIGQYSYPKWGATCTVDVYAMQVSEMLAEDEWEEKHRGREWVSPERAAERLKQKELAPMVLALADRLRPA